MENFKLEAPDLSKLDRAKVLNKYFEFLEKNPQANFVYRLSEPKYLYWDDIKHKPIPKDFSISEVWLIVREIRKLSSRPTPVIAENGKPFTF